MPAPPPSCADDGEESGSLTLDAARAAMLAAVEPIEGLERVDLTTAVERILGEPVVAAFDVPPRANSAVDGYAVRAADLPALGREAELPVRGTVLAGPSTASALEAGSALRIMTGAPLPENADTVLMQEHVAVLPDAIRIDGRHRLGDNVRQAGEDIKTGVTVLQPGRRLTPADIGLVASLGLGEIGVRRRLRVALLSTGDELREIGEAKPAGCIHDSNRYALRAALQRFGADAVDLGIIPDDPRSLREALLAAAHADTVVSTGGVSAGEADYIKQVLADIGDIAFWKVAIKPGRPIAFGRIGSATFFGLPGNPVAVLVTYYQLVLPALERLAGRVEPATQLSLKARCEVRLRKKPGRTEFQRGIVFPGEDGGWRVRTTGEQGSGILSSMSLANAFIVLPHEGGPVEPGDEVTVMPFAGLIY